MDRDIRLKVLTLNTNGMRDDNKRKMIFEYIKQQGADIICLQETHSSIEIEDKWTKEWNGKAYWNSENEHTAGTAILIARKRNSYKITDTTKDTEGRFMHICIQAGNTKLYISNLHAHNHRVQRRSQLRQLVARTRKFHTQLIAGDFNGIDVSELDREPANTKKDEGDAKFNRRIMGNMDVKDTYRDINGNQKDFTFFYAGGKSRLDRIYASKDIKVIACNHVPCSFSDHDAVIATVQLDEPAPRQRNTWKNNTMTYSKDDFQEEFRTKWNQWATLHQTIYATKAEWWEAVKRRLKHLVIKHAARARKTQKEQREKREQKLNRVRVNVIRNNAPQTEYRKAKKEVWNEKAEDLAKLQLEAKAEKEEVLSSKPYMLCEKIKRRQETASIQEMKDASGKLTSDQSKIRNIVESFYRSLYSKRDIDQHLANSLFRHQKGRLTTQQKEQIDAPIKVEEIKRAILQQRTNRTPGEDGISAEFYIQFLDTIAGELTNVFDELYSQQKATGKLGNGIIKTIYKKGDATNIKNYRPITLLNVDYKILSKILSNRLKEVLPDITHHHQFVNPPNTIGKLNLMLREITTEMKARGRGALISIDFEKAYDSVNHDFLHKALKETGFGNKFRDFFKTIYDQGEAKISIGGTVGKSMKIRAGIKQGDPISMYLFTVVTETLLQKLNQSITGYKMMGMKERIATPAYADDITITLEKEEQSQNAIETIDEFGRASGLRINQEKTKGVTFERKKLTNRATTITWVSGINLLGNTIGNGIRRSTQQWEEAMNKSIQLFNDAADLHLKRYEKTEIIKTNVLPLFTYIAATSKMPKSIQKQLKTEVAKFLFGLERKVEYAKFIQLEKQGGLGVVDIPTFADMAFIKPALKYLERADALPEGDWNRRLEHQLAILLTKYRYHQISNSRPHTSKPLKHWEEVKKTMVEMKMENVDIQRKAREIYRTTIARQNTREVSEMQGPNWGNINHSCLTRDQRKLNWEIAHRLLATNERLQARLAARTRDCALCNLRIETHEHLFFRCRCTKPVLDLILDSWERVTGGKEQERGLKAIISMEPEKGLTRSQHICFLTLTSIYKQAVWNARNIKKHEGRNIGILRSFKHRMGKRRKSEEDESTEKDLEKIKNEISGKTPAELTSRGIKLN